MWEAIKRFMCNEDPNGDWFDLEKTEYNVMTVHNTITEWLNDGLELTPSIDAMCIWLAAEYAELTK